MTNKDAYDDDAIVKAIEQMALDGTLRGGRQKNLVVKLDVLRRKLQRIGIAVAVRHLATLIEDLEVERDWSNGGRVNIGQIEHLARQGRFTQYCEELASERSRTPLIQIQTPWGTPADAQGPPPAESLPLGAPPPLAGAITA